MSYLYGKWTQYLRTCKASLYEEMAERAKQKSKTPQNNQTHKKVLAKFNSLKVGSFRPLNQDAIDTSDNDNCLEGFTTDNLFESIVLWEVTPRPSNCAEYYQFTAFAMTLNEIEEGMKENLCPTDSRLRPDIRKLENGDQNEAASQKMRLEEKQRDRCKIRKQKKDSSEWIPRWFEKSINLYTGLNDWTYLGNYWNRNYHDIEDIF